MQRLILMRIYLLLEQGKLNDDLVQNGLESLNNQVELENDQFNFLEGEFGFDAIQESYDNFPGWRVWISCLVGPCVALCIQGFIICCLPISLCVPFKNDKLFYVAPSPQVCMNVFTVILVHNYFYWTICFLKRKYIHTRSKAETRLRDQVKI